MTGRLLDPVDDLFSGKLHANILIVDALFMTAKVKNHATMYPISKLGKSKMRFTKKNVPIGLYGTPIAKTPPRITKHSKHPVLIKILIVVYINCSLIQSLRDLVYLRVSGHWFCFSLPAI